MKIADKLCKSMNKFNEDVICYGSFYAFVIDGQSMGKSSRLVKSYVNTLKKNLKKNIYNKNLEDALNRAIISTAETFKKNYNKVPSATISIIRQNKDKIEILIVGNPKCLIETKKIEIVEDKRMDLYEENLLNKIKYLHKTEKISILEAKDKIKETLNKNRNNGAYPVICDKKLTENDFIYKEYNYDDVISAIICTDGFYAYKDYLMIKDNNLYDIVKNQGLDYCYSHIRRMESKDTNLNSFPRLKLYDDASALYIKFY
jgi:hypothetical protein